METISFFERSNEIDEATTVNNFEFKSVLPPPKIEHLHSFEERAFKFDITCKLDITSLHVISNLKELIQYSEINLLKITIGLIRTHCKTIVLRETILWMVTVFLSALQNTC